MRRSLFVGALVACAVRAFGGESALTLSPDAGEIVVAAKAAPAVRYAATELNDVLARSFGRALPVVARPTAGKVSLILGDNAWARAAGIDVNALAQDGFVLRAASNVVYIAGRDDPKFDLPRYVKEGHFSSVVSTQHATVFGVYDFLERVLGARFYFPGELGTVVPRHASVAIGKLDVVSEPACTIRDYYPGGGGVAPGEQAGSERIRSEWKARILLYQRMSTVHIPLCHGQNKFEITKRFAKTHPEYFALLKDLKTGELRRDTDPENKMAFHPNQLCQSSRLWEDVLYPETKAQLLGGKKYVDIMPTDGMRRCLCDLCTAACSKDPDDRQYATDLMWTRTAWLAQRLIDEKVPGFVTQMAYPPYRRIPAFDLPTNILIQVAEKGPWGTQFPDVWKRDNAEIRGWAEKLGHKVWIWNYPGKWGQYLTPGVPPMSPKAWAKYYKSVFPWSFGAFAESESDRAIFNYLNHYVFSKVMWDPSVDTDALLKEHYRVMFGAAADLVERFYDDLEHKWIEEVTGHGRAQATSLGPGMYAFPSEFAIRTAIYGPQEIARWERLFDEALARTGAATDEGRRVAYVREQFLKPLADANGAYVARIDAAAEARRRAELKPVNLLGAEDLCAAKGRWWTRPVEFVKGAGYGGADAIRLVCVSNRVGTGRSFGDAFLEKGRRYRVSYYVKQGKLGGTGGGAYVEYVDAGAKSARDRYHFVAGSPVRDAHDWIAQSFEFTAGEGQVPENKSCLQVFLNAPGEAWISGILLEKAEAKRLECWAWLISSMGDEAEFAKATNIVQRGAASGYNALVLSGGEHMYWQAPRLERVKRLDAYMKTLGMELIPCGWSSGYGGTASYSVPDVVESTPMKGVRYKVSGGRGRFVADTVTTGLEGRTFATNITLKLSGKVKPYRTYLFSCRCRTENISPLKYYSVRGNVFHLENGKSKEWELYDFPVESTQDWKSYEWEFNTYGTDELTVTVALNRNLKVTGACWFDSIKVEELPLSRCLTAEDWSKPVVRSAASGKVYAEGVDYEPFPRMKSAKRSAQAIEIVLKRGGAIAEGEELLVDCHVPAIQGAKQFSLCPSCASLEEYWRKTVRNTEEAIHPKRWLMSVDEWRVANRCAKCRARKVSPGRLMGESVARFSAIVREVNPKAEICAWADMFCPLENAGRNPYYCVDGSMLDSWEYVPKDLVMVPWMNGRDVVKTTNWLMERGFRCLAGGYYNYPDLSRDIAWRDACKSNPLFLGMMFTTWGGAYADGGYYDLEAYGKMVHEK